MRECETDYERKGTSLERDRESAFVGKCVRGRRSLCVYRQRERVREREQKCVFAVRRE